MSAAESMGPQWDKKPLYHITDNPKFALDPTHQPENNAISIDRLGPNMPAGVFLTRHPESWVNGHDYVRPYVAEFHAHEAVENMAGGFGGEKFVPAEHYDKLRLNRVIPLDAHAREQYQSSGWIEEHHGTTFDSDAPIRSVSNSYSQALHERPYTYNGPDVRDMPEHEVARHHARWVRYMKENRGIDI